VLDFKFFSSQVIAGRRRGRGGLLTEGEYAALVAILAFQTIGCGAFMKNMEKLALPFCLSFNLPSWLPRR
jgi:hypothetical protein